MMFLVTIVTGVWAKNQKYEDCTHVPGEPVQENVDGPYCTTGGSYDKVTYCTLCGEELSREKMYTDALGHNYNGQVCYPTCEENGYTTFTCSRCGDSYTDDYTDALGHDWGNATYTWANDYSKVTASRTCQRDASHVDSETVQTTREETKEQTATEPGEITYTATFTKYGFTTQTKVVKTEDRTGCDSFYWSRNGTTYTVSGEYTYDDGTDIYKLLLTIHYSTSEIWEREVYMGQHFEEGPFDFVVTSETELTQTGVTTNAEGCDNVITLLLTIVQGPGIDVEEAQTGYDFGEVPPGELAKIDIAVTNSANFGVQAKVTVPDGFDWEKMLLFTNNYGWEKVYLYAWDADGTPLTGAWPGTELTKTITNDYAQQQHIATIPIGTTGIIFTAGADGPQTSDISDFNVEGYYMYEGSLYSWGEEPQFAIPANSEGTLTVYLTSDDPGVRSGNIVLEPRMGDTTPIVIPISAIVSTGIDSLTPDNAAKGKEIWYDLSGRRLMGEPTQHGVYINKGKKVNK